MRVAPCVARSALAAVVRWCLVPRTRSRGRPGSCAPRSPFSPVSVVSAAQSASTAADLALAPFDSFPAGSFRALCFLSIVHIINHMYEG